MLVNSCDLRSYRGSRYSEKLSDGKDGEHLWLVQDVLDAFSRNIPHLILVMATEDIADDNSILRCELLAMISFMLARYRNKSYRNHVFFPVSLITVNI